LDYPVTPRAPHLEDVSAPAASGAFGRTGLRRESALDTGFQEALGIQHAKELD